MRSATCLAAALLTTVLGPLALPTPALADDLQATRYDMIERAHVVEMRVDRGFATLVVQRTVANSGPKSDQAIFHLDIPTTAVATRLRTSGVNGSGQDVWFEGELMEAEAAAKKYQELTGIGGYYPKDPALLSWRSRGSLALQVFPVLARSTKSVEYTLKLPLEYKDGAYRVELPRMGTEALAATVRISAARPEDSLAVNDVTPTPGGPQTITALAGQNLSITLRPRGGAPIEAALASVQIAEGKHLVHGRISAAPRIAEVPRGAHVVVLFDSSRSHHDADAGLAAVRAYLGHMTGATVDFLTFDREVRAPIGRGLSVATALSKLAELRLELRNGSALDEALAKADAILTASASQARRVVVVTDTLTRSDLTPAKVGVMSWKSGAVLHVATVENRGAPALAREDDSPWATLPRRTGGLFWTGTNAPDVSPATRVAFEAWARPKQIDKLVVRGLTGGFSAPDMLEEGQGLDHFVIADSATSRVDVDGELWSKPLHLSFAPSAEQGKLDAALVFGTDLASELSEPEQMKLAMLGRAVSPVTSYLAIEPGVRPSNEGLEWGLTGTGMGGGGSGGTGIGLGSVATLCHAGSVDKAEWLRRALMTAATTCAPTATEIDAHLESNYDEVVDVVRVVLAPTRDAKAESCVREELWKVTLPPVFASAFESHTVTTRP